VRLKGRLDYTKLLDGPSDCYPFCISPSFMSGKPLPPVPLIKYPLDWSSSPCPFHIPGAL
jgi:hypothetical protein